MLTKQLAKLRRGCRIRIFFCKQVKARDLRMRGDVEIERFSFTPDFKRDGERVWLVDFLNPSSLKCNGDFL